MKPEATEEEIEILQSQGNFSEMFANQILSTERIQARDVMSLINNQAKDRMMLEQSTQELSQLFLDLNILQVESQGEFIDQIENNIAQATSYTKEGVQELKAANKYSKNKRKVMSYTLIDLIHTYYIIGFPEGGQRRKKGHSYQACFSCSCWQG